jgi:23S rRNA pseudouridine2604 synthase
MNQKGTMQLNKFISESGLCSRREADRYVAQGNVYINGHKAIATDKVTYGDQVRVNGHDLEPRSKEDIVFIALNKPVGITSTAEKNVKGNIVTFVNHPQRIFPIGRLDKDSQGLIFLTNDGDMVNKILRAGNKHEKEYMVTVDKPLTDTAIMGMANGVPMLGVTTKKCRIVQEGAKTFRIVLVQGLNRQIRRMCEHFGYNVLKLERVRIMNISLKGLPEGDWRELTEEELKSIQSMVSNSSSEPIKKKQSKSFSKNKLRREGEERIFSKKTSFSAKPFKGKTGQAKFEQKSGKPLPKKSRNAAGKAKSSAPARRGKK